MKKTTIALSIVLSVLLATLVFGLVTITGSSVKSIQGAQGVVYPVYLDNDEGIAGFQVDVNYSTTDLALIGIEPTSRTENATIVYNDQSPLVKIAVLVNDTENEIPPGDGAVLNLVFDVDESAQTGSYDVDLDGLVAANISAIALDVSEVDGLFEIVEPYGFEFLPPISLFENFTLQEGATLPLKFNVTDGNGFVVDESVLVKVHNASQGVYHIYNASGTGDDFITINEAEGLYLVNVHTGQLDMPEGVYDIDVIFNNSQEETIGFELVSKSQGIGKGKNKN